MSPDERDFQAICTPLGKTLLSLSGRAPTGPGRKRDGSWVTDVDREFEAEILDLVARYFELAGMCVVSEENESSHRERYDISGGLVVVDPIDGTENFIAGSPLYGSAVSIVRGSRALHMLCVPAWQRLVTSMSPPARRPEASVSVDLYSTKCIPAGVPQIDSARVLGSAAVSFAEFLRGGARSYTYCGGAKIWDCYSGLALAAGARCGARLGGSRAPHTEGELTMADWLRSPTHVTAFELRWP